MAKDNELGGVLEVRLLGELTLSVGSRPLALPASKKSRALLAYLIATQRVHLRERVCELLWDAPGDARAGLRWSLTKIRPLLDHGGVRRLVADRERVGFEPQRVEIDIDVIRRELSADIDRVPTETLRRAVVRFRGELLEGLDLPACYRYHAWCIAERESARRLRMSVLAALAARLESDPEQAIHFARARVAVDPLVESSHVALIGLLVRCGRLQEAREQYDLCRRILEVELKTRPSAELELVRARLNAQPQPLRASPRPQPAERPYQSASSDASPPSLAGRKTERAIIDAHVEAATRGDECPLLLFLGDPGMGKTRMLEHLAGAVRKKGGKVWWGRAFEAELVRPYGAWIDALRSMALPDLPAAVLADLSPLLPEVDSSGSAASERNRLFDAVAHLLCHLAEPGAPSAVILDDLQWLDEASAALLHFVARSLGGRRVIVASAARPGELSDNKAALRLARSLTRERRLLQVGLAPLDREAIAELVHSVAVAADPARIYAESEGLPLFALEMAWAARQGGSSGPARLERLIDNRLDELEGRAAEALPWAAALGRSFRAELLAKACAIPLNELLVAIDELERRAIIRSAPSAGSGGVFDFAHDLVRQAAYRRISESRRTLMHLQIARTLASIVDREGALAGDLAHHAALGEDDELCVRACADAGDRCLRLFAKAEAIELADRGLARVHGLAREVRLRFQIRLLRLKVRAGVSPLRAPELEVEISRVVLEAQVAGLFSDAAMALYVVSELHWARGDLRGATKTSLQSAEASRGADRATAAQTLASSGRCLAQLEQHMPRALAMLEEAISLSASVGLELVDTALGLGIVQHHLGHDDAAVDLLLRAHHAAAQALDHWLDWQSLARLARVELDRNGAKEALSYCTELGRLASKMGEGSEGAVTEAIEALARMKLGEPDMKARALRAIVRLREIDTKAFLAYALCSVAEWELGRDNYEAARPRAVEAVAAAEAVGRRSDAARGRIILARIALATRDTMAARAELEPIYADLARPMEVAAGVRAHAAAVVAAIVAIEQNL